MPDLDTEVSHVDAMFHTDVVDPIVPDQGVQSIFCAELIGEL
jgi:hypothetical protein